MQGLGYFIWQLPTIAAFYTSVQLADLLRQANVKWVSWKLAEGIYRYNQVGGNDKIIIEYMQALEAAGIVSGGWSYNYPEKPGTQSGIIAERVAKFSNNLNKFDHWMLDIEGEWKKPVAGATIDNLLAIDISAKFPVGFCSYRYPELHSQVNFGRFLKNPTIHFNAPQVYWIEAHNPAAQMDKSFEQYSKITQKPFVPIGSAFGVGDWEPTEADLKEFVAHAIERKWYTYGFWSLDYIIKKQRFDWLEAIGGQSVTPPPEPPSTLPDFVRVSIAGANIRTAAKVDPLTDVGDLALGAKLPVVGQSGDWYEVGPLFVHKTVVKPE